MPPMVDPFEAGGFTYRELSLALSEFPILYGRLQQLQLFEPVYGADPKIAIERFLGTNVLVPTKRRGAAGTPSRSEKRDLRDFTCYHVPLEDEILPDEIQGIRLFGSSSEYETATNVMARKLRRLARLHSITMEAFLAGAVQGVIKDADNSTLTNLFTAFGVTEVVVGFDLDNAASNIRSKCMDVNRYTEDGLGGGDIFTRVRGLAGKTFFSKLVEHAKVKDDFKYQLSERNREDVRRGFEYGGIVYEEYRANAPQPDGTVRTFIPDTECRFVPEGTTDTFKNFFAPADFMETTNTIALPMYAKVEPRKYNRGWDIHSQTNPGPLCTRPLCLVKGTVAP